MNVLDLFSGIGGFSLGLERAGMRTVAFCERDSFCRRVLDKHWPNVPIFDDVKTLDVTQIDADLYAGGFPCTQTSVAAAIHGKRVGLNGKDSGLWFEYIRHVKAGRPQWVIVENPGGIEAWEGEVKGGLESAGYRVSRLAFKASDFGLPHLRRRYFYVANRDGKRLEIARPARPSTTEWVTRLAAHGGAWLADTPRAGRGIDGVPDRVDRVHSLGNAVVPQIPEIIGRAIMRADS